MKTFLPRKRGKMPSIYIFGLFPDSSGKTVLATALARGLLNDGIEVGVFKPRSGHNMWYQYDAFLKCKNEGGLFCEDIIKLRESAKCSLPYEILNPIDALMAPLNAERFLSDNMANWMYLLDPEMYRHLVVERYTSANINGEVENVLLLNEKNIRERYVLTDEEYLTTLKEKAKQIINVKGVDEWTAYFNRYSSKAIGSCYQTIKKRFDTVIIEGYNDAASPEEKLILNTDIFIGTAPGVTVIYEPEEYKRVIETMMKLNINLKGLRAKEIIRFLRNYNILKIEPIRREDMEDYDRLSERFRDVIDYVEERIG